MLTLLLLCTYLSLCCDVEARYPGVIVQLSRKGLKYATDIAIDELQKSILNHGVPDYKSSEGHLTYHLSSVRMTSFTKPGSTLVTDPDVGITLSLTNLGVQLSGDWNYKYKLSFIPIQDSGTFDVSVGSASVKIYFSMGADANGRPTIEFRSCQSNVNGVSVTFHGGASWIYNMFTTNLERHLADGIQHKLCDALKELINIRAKKNLEKMKVVTNVGKYITLDYRLVAAPVFGSNYLESLHKGEVYWKNDRSETPFMPKPIHYDPTGSSKCLTLCLNDYVMTSASYTSYTHGRDVFAYNLTKKDLPKENWRYLDIDAFPQLAKKFPNSTIELHMYATKPPSYQTVNNTMVFLLHGNTEFKIRTPKRELVDWFTLGLVAKSSLSMKMTGHNVTGKVKHFRFRSTVLRKQMDPVPKPLIDAIFKFVFRDFIVPQINGLARKGYPLPHLESIKYIDPELHLLQGGFCFAVDLEYIR